MGALCCVTWLVGGMDGSDHTPWTVTSTSAPAVLITRSKSTAVLLYILVASFQYIIPDNIEPLTPPNSREFFLKLVRFVEAFGRDCLKCLNFKKPIDDEFCFLDCKFKGPNLVTIIQSRHLFANTTAPSMD